MGACVSKAAVEEMLREKDIRINELVGDLDAAKSEKSAALDEAQELKKRLEDELEKIESLEEQGKQKDTEIGTLKESTQKLEKDLDDTRKEKDAQISELNEKTQNLEKELDDTRKEKDAQISELSDKTQRLEQDLEDTRQEKDAQISDLNHKTQELVKDLDDTRKEKDAQISDLNDKTQKLEKDLDDTRKETGAQISDLNEKTTKLEAVLEDTRKEKDAQIADLNENTTKLEADLEDTRKVKDAEITELNEKNEKLRKENVEKDANTENLTKQLRESEDKHDEYALEIHQLKAANAAKEKEMAALKEKTKGWGFGGKKKEDPNLKAPAAAGKDKRKNSRSILDIFAGKDKSSSSKDKKLGTTAEETKQRKSSATSQADSEYSSSGYEPMEETPSIKAESLRNPEDASNSSKENGDKQQVTSDFLKGQTILYVGELSKKNPGGLAGMHLWKTRFCVLTPKAFHYFGKASDPKPKGTLLLEQVRTVAHQPQDARKFGIAMKGDDRVYDWKADNDEAVDRWIKAIDDARRG